MWSQKERSSYVPVCILCIYYHITVDAVTCNRSRFHMLGCRLVVETLALAVGEGDTILCNSNRIE